MYNQEYIVDEIIKKDLTKQYPELKKLIKKTSPHEIRGGIMSVLDKDRRVYRDIKFYENLNKECEYNTYTDEIVVNVRKYIEVADCEVKDFGEVMTPISLVEDMLNTLPDDVWTNKDLKWFDPCAGIGTFPSVIVQRLMKGLKKQIPNPKKRYKHIIEEMIYVCELQAKNLFAFHYIFDKPDIYELNTFYGSFLTDEFNEHMKNEWNIEKFDIIVGNPPYQENNLNQRYQKSLWDKFVLKSLDILFESGFLCMVHPAGWRNVSGKFKELQKIMFNKKITYLEIHNEKDGLKIFGAETRYDFYCLQNTRNNILTRIKGEDGVIEEVDLTKLNFLPNGKISQIISLVAKNNEEKVNLLCGSEYSTSKSYLSKIKTDTHIYPIISIVRKNGDIEFIYSDRNLGQIGTKKVMWSNTRITSIGTFVDKDGKYGMTQFGYSIVDKVKNLDLISDVLKSQNFISLMRYCCISSFPSLNEKILSTFRKDFYKQFLND
jgi:hypothetical protein